jgi:hypothetical protein
LLTVKFGGGLLSLVGANVATMKRLIEWHVEKESSIAAQKIVMTCGIEGSEERKRNNSGNIISKPAKKIP